MGGGVLDAAATWEAMQRSVVAFETARDAVVVRGPDAASWLQGQVSQDVPAIETGDAADSLLLTPEGRLVALLRVARIGPEELLLDAETGTGEAIEERLRRFRLRVKVQLERASWPAVSFRGPGAAAAAATAAVAAGAAGGAWALPWRWAGDEGWDLVGPAAAVPDGVPLGDRGVSEATRIAAGVPRWGSELSERTIPHEAGVVARTVSFDKGCYTGQELVARLDARGARTPRRLRGVVFPPAPAGAALPEAGAELRAGGKVVGALTSVAWWPATGSPIALAYARREVVPPEACETDYGTVRIEELPLAAPAPGG